MNQSNEDKMEQLNLEVTVILTEKSALKKELSRVNNAYHKLESDFKEQRVNYDLLVNEVTAANKANSGYRTLIRENEQKLGVITIEIMDL